MGAERRAGTGSFPQPVLMGEAPSLSPTMPFMLKDQMIKCKPFLCFTLHPKKKYRGPMHLGFK